MRNIYKMKLQDRETVLMNTWNNWTRTQGEVEVVISLEKMAMKEAKYYLSQV